jgi:hypothetical protein
VRCPRHALVFAGTALVLALTGCSSSSKATAPTTTKGGTLRITVETSTSAVTTTTTAGSKPAGRAGLGNTPEEVRARLGVLDPERSTDGHDVFGKCDTSTQSNIYEYSVQYQDGRAFTVTRQTCDAVSKADNLPAALSFVPADAQRVGSVRHDTPGEDDYTYSSDTLAELPSSLFIGCDPGSFVVAVDSSGWTLATVGCIG